MPDPARAGARVGHRRHPPRPPPVGHVAAAGVLRRLPGPGRRLPPADPAAVDASSEREAGFPFRQLAADEGVLFPDHFDNAWRAGQPRAGRCGEIADLRPGVTEIHVQPAIDTPGGAGHLPRRRGLGRRPRPDHGPDAARGARRRRARCAIGYRELRDLMRREAARQLGLTPGLPAQACACSTSAAAPERRASNSTPVSPDGLEPALHVGDRRIEAAVGLGDGDHDVGAVRPDRRSRPSCPARRGTGRCPPRRPARSPARRLPDAGEQVVLERARRPGSPTSDRARIQSS